MNASSVFQGKDRSALVEAFRAMPTGNICDAMEQLGLGCGAVHGLLPVSTSQPRAVGFAVTVRQATRHHVAKERQLAKHASVIDELLGPDDMLVIDAGGRKDVCTGGAILALRAQIKGAAGFVVNGCMRDFREIAELGFPVHLAGSSPVKSSPTLQTVAINEVVEIGNTQIRQGDLIVTDDTGIVTIAIEVAQQVLARAQEIQAKEAFITQLVKEGVSFSDALRRHGEQESA